MKYKIIVTIILFIFSVLYLKNGIYFIKENDSLMKIIKEKQSIYNINPVDAIITNNTIIPGVNGRKINIEKSYNKMKLINEFRESLLVFDIIKPNKSIENIYNKIIVSGNQNINKISIILKNDDNYCFTEKLKINNNCKNKQTILINRITSNHLTKVKELVRNGIIFFLELKDINELNIITKYLKNNNYEIVSISELIKE